jgi:hypothetical protein
MKQAQKVYIRAKIQGKWDNFSLTDLVNLGEEGQNELKHWFTDKLFNNPMTLDDAEKLLKILKNNGVKIVMVDDKAVRDFVNALPEESIKSGNFFAIGGDELKELPEIEVINGEVECPNCKQMHKYEINQVLGFVTCTQNKESYLVSIATQDGIFKKLDQRT